jgi:hypothetical protein
MMTVSAGMIVFDQMRFGKIWDSGLPHHSKNNILVDLVESSKR